LRITKFARGTTNEYLIDNELIEYVNEGHEQFGEQLHKELTM
jgi:hypothetical protein